MESIGDRMKNNYENRSRYKLTRRTPVIIRIDGKAFHTLTKSFDKPFDKWFRSTMCKTAEVLCDEIQGALMAYVQSDEISILATDFKYVDTQAWFDYNLQKMSSVSASIATTVFNRELIMKWMDYNGGLRFDIEHREELSKMKLANFDSRCFNIPKEEVHNYFVWRQQDWLRNSKQMYGRSFFSQKELQNKNTSEIIEMCKEKGNDWNSINSEWKYGNAYFKNKDVWVDDMLFTQYPNEINSIMEA